MSAWIGETLTNSHIVHSLPNDLSVPMQARGAYLPCNSKP